MSEALLAHRAHRPDELSRLQTLLDTVLEENRQLRDALVPPVIFPSEWKLRPAQARILACFLGSPNGVRTKEQLFQAISGRDGMHDDNTVKVSICDLRKKLAPYGIEILTRWAIGYELPTDSRVFLKEVLQS